MIFEAKRKRPEILAEMATKIWGKMTQYLN